MAEHPRQREWQGKGPGAGIGVECEGNRKMADEAGALPERNSGER